MVFSMQILTFRMNVRFAVVHEMTFFRLISNSCAPTDPPDYTEVYDTQTGGIGSRDMVHRLINLHPLNDYDYDTPTSAIGFESNGSQTWSFINPSAL